MATGSYSDSRSANRLIDGPSLRETLAIWIAALPPCRHARESGHPGQATESRALVVTIDGGEWLQGAGQFNFLDRLTDAVWESPKPKKK